MTTLIVALPTTPPTASALCQSVLSDDGRSVLRTQETPLSLLSAPPGGDIVALVPAARLSWHRLELPRGALKAGMFQEGGATRLRAVLDGLLEDRVLDDTAQLHFAIEPAPRADQPVWVAACDRAWLNAWLAALAQAGRPVARIVPELAPVTPPAADEPAGQASLTLTGTPEQARLMLAGADGVTVLPLSVASAALLAWPEDAPLRAEPGVAVLAEHFFNRPATLQTTPERWLAAANTRWDLAQFDLRYTRGTRTRKHLAALWQAPRWRAARWAALALVVINLAGLQAWAWKEQSALAAQRAAIKNTLTQTFPDLRVVVDAPVQMARALADLQRRNGTASNADLETMLVQFQAAAPDAPAPSAIEFVAGELRLKGLGGAAGDPAALSARLKPQGYSARLDGDSLVIKEERQP
ncbi:MAG: type II secretion system protein GspL [Polaromonas sp.]